MTPAGGAAHRPDLGLVEAGDLALRGGDDDVVLARGHVDPGQLIVGGDGDGDDAAAPDPLELLERGLLDDAVAGGHDQELAGIEVGQGDRGHRDLAGLHLDAREVDDRDALGLAARVDDGVDLGREDPAAVGEEERPVVGVGHEEVLDRVLLAGHVADDPLPAPALAAIGGNRLALDVAAPADRDDDVLVGDEVLVRHLAAGVVGDAGPARAGVLGLDGGELVLDDGQDARRVGEDVLELGDELDDLEVLVLDLLALEGGQAGQAHVQDRLGLDLGQAEAGHQVGAGRVDVGRLADRLDHLVEVVERDLEAFQDVSPRPSLLQVELGPAPDDLAPVIDVVLQDGLEREASAAGRRPGRACSC